MDNLLKTLFSYQDYEKDPDLLRLKEETEDKYSGLLTEDELAFAVGGNSEYSILEKEVKVKIGGTELIGKIVDIKPDMVLVDTVGWVDRKNIFQ